MRETDKEDILCRDQLYRYNNRVLEPIGLKTNRTWALASINVMWQRAFEMHL